MPCAGLALSNLHPISLSLDVASPKFNTGCPSQLYWMGRDRSWLVAHCFHLHPLAVRLQGNKGRIGNSIDGDWLESLAIAESAVHTSKGDEAIYVYELSPGDRSVGRRTHGFSFSEIERFAIRSTNALHRRNVTERIYFNGADVPPQVLQRIDETIKTVVENERSPLHYRLLVRDFYKRTRRALKMTRRRLLGRNPQARPELVRAERGNGG